MRGLLDGHVWLSRRLAEKGHFPAVDVLRSISRLMNEISEPEHKQGAQLLRRLLAVLHENEDLLAIGAYRKGTNREIDVAVAMREEIHALLKQEMDERMSLEEVRTTLTQLAHKCKQLLTGNGVAATQPEPDAATSRATES
jgi:flagellum-specific ATP synthase